MSEMRDEQPTFPCPVPPKPPIARQHCRHYGSWGGGILRGGGPTCAMNVPLIEPAARNACMPPDSQRGATCSAREEWTASERAAWKAWSDHHRERMLVIFAAIPDDYGGEIPCPACGTGRVRYARARSNRHLHAACSTPNCFEVMQ